MKRTPMKPRKSPLRRRSRLRSRGRAKGRFPGRRDDAAGVYAEWIRSLPCLVTGRQTGGRGAEVPFACKPEADGYLPDEPLYFKAKIEACHVRTRGAGGNDLGNLVPLDWQAHREQHRIGIKSFQAKYGVDLRAEAARLYDRWTQERGKAA